MRPEDEEDIDYDKTGIIELIDARVDDVLDSILEKISFFEDGAWREDGDFPRGFLAALDLAEEIVTSYKAGDK